jgi:hypothetical protein
MASGTDGEILTYDASGNPTSVSVGTDGQVLTSTGVGSPPAFETAAAGGKLLQVVSAKLGSTNSFTSTSQVSIMSTSITISSGSNIYMMVSPSTYGNGSYNSWHGTTYAYVWLGGSQIYFGSYIGSKYTSEGLSSPTFHKLVTGLSAGSHTFELKQAVVNGGTRWTDTNTSITLMEIGA